MVDKFIKLRKNKFVKHFWSLKYGRPSDNKVSAQFLLQKNGNMYKMTHTRFRDKIENDYNYHLLLSKLQPKTFSFNKI